MLSAPTFYVVPGSTVKRVIDDNKKQVFDAVEAAYARLRDELLNGEIFYTLREAQIIIESWRRHYNAVRPHASLGFKPPAPEAFVPAFSAWPASLRRPAPPATLAQPPTLN